MRWVWRLFLVLLLEEITDFFEESGLIFLDLRGLFFLLLFGLLGEAFSTFAYLVQSPNQHEDDEGDKEEVDDSLDEVAVIDGSWLDSFNVGGDGDLEGTEVKTADNHRNDRHDYVIDERGDDGCKSTTNDDTDGEIHDRTAVDEFFEFFKHISPLFNRFGGFRDSPNSASSIYMAIL